MRAGEYRLYGCDFDSSFGCRSILLRCRQARNAGINLLGAATSAGEWRTMGEGDRSSADSGGGGGGRWTVDGVVVVGMRKSVEKGRRQRGRGRVKGT